MSCVALAKAVMMKNISVTVNMLMGVVPASIIASPGEGSVMVSRMRVIAMRICIVVIHQRFFLMMSTKGLHNGLITHGR